MKLPIIEKLEKEIQKTSRELHVDIPKALKIATDMGDLSENAEYKAAKERQMFLEARLSLLQKRVSEITSININQIPRDRSGLWSTLFLKDLSTGEEKKYELVFPEEVDPELGKISTASPVGRAILGRREGDAVAILLPEGTKEYEVVRIQTIHDNPSETSA